MEFDTEELILVFFFNFPAFGTNAPITSKVILVYLNMFVSIQKTPHTDPVLGEQSNFPRSELI